MTSPDPALIALDWGTSSLRAFLLDREGAVIDRVRSASGLMNLGPGGFVAAFDDATAAWRARWPHLRAIACGMVGSAQGWREAPYLDCPARPEDLAGRLVAAGERDVMIVPGLRRTGPRSDVMRGEETQIAGALAQDPTLAGAATLVLPGTHCKWATVADGRVAGFATYMTGELYAILRQHSILGRFGSGGTGSDAAFLRGVEVARGADEGLAPLLFSARALVLTGALAAEDSPAYLSGLLIGDEIRAGLADPDAPLVLIGEPALTARYRRALGLFGARRVKEIEDAAARGLWRIAGCAGLVSAA